HDGVVDRDTFLWIEKGFKGESGLRRYARAAQREAPGLKNTPKRQDADHPQTALMRETHHLAPDEKIEANQVITPAAVAGQKADPLDDAKAYEAELQTLLRTTIDEKYADAKQTAKHHDHGPTFSMGTLADLGTVAKGKADAVFGSWATGPKLTPGVTIKDRYVADRERQKALPPGGKHDAARSRARYFMNTLPTFTALDDK